jgi:hypothetical protein
MRIGISGTHGTGKTTLAEALCAPGHHPFTSAEKNGPWQPAIEVPGISGLNAEVDAEAEAVSCASAGNCALAGFYHDQVNQTLPLPPAGDRGVAKRLRRSHSGDTEATSILGGDGRGNAQSRRFR